MEQDLNICYLYTTVLIIIHINQQALFQILLHSEVASNYLSWIHYRELLATQHTVFTLAVATCTSQNEAIYVCLVKKIH